MFLRRFLIALFLFFINQISFADSDFSSVCSTHSCRIIIDAGSSGTRVHLYAYDKDENRDLSNVEELVVNKIKPGLSELELEQIPDYLSNLMKNIPENEFTIDFYATAGMRMLPEYKQYAIYATVRNWFEKHKNWHLMETRTITGAEEGMFGWLAMNYMIRDKAQDLPGFIEIGGASTQVVFPINDYAGIKSEDIITFKYKRHRISLFSHSFLGLGANEIMKKFTNLHSCFPQEYALDNGEFGHGDGILCQQEIINSLNSNNNISETVQHPLNINPVNTWYTVGAIGNISQKSPLNIVENEFTIAELFSKADAMYCKQPWNFQQQNYALSDAYLNQNCLISSFFYALTTTGYGIDQNQTFKTFANGQESDWTVGVLQINKNMEFHGEK